MRSIVAIYRRHLSSPFIFIVCPCLFSFTFLVSPSCCHFPRSWSLLFLYEISRPHLLSAFLVIILRLHFLSPSVSTMFVQFSVANSFWNFSSKFLVATCCHTFSWPSISTISCCLLSGPFLSLFFVCYCSSPFLFAVSSSYFDCCHFLVAFSLSLHFCWGFDILPLGIFAFQFIFVVVFSSPFLPSPPDLGFCLSFQFNVLQSTQPMCF